MVVHMKNKKMSIKLNIVIILLEILGFSLSIIKYHHIAIEYYTNQSNLIALFTSILFVIFYKSKSRIINDLRFITTSTLTLTFLVVLFILTPMYNYNYKLLMFTEEFCIFHTIVPIISLISYLFYERRSKKDYLGFLYTIIYCFIFVQLNICGVISGPYPFLKVKEQSIIISIIWFIIIVGGSYLIGYLINQTHKITNKRS